MKENCIYIPTRDNNNIFNCKTIVYAESFRENAKLRFETNEEVEVLLSLAELEMLLKKYGFFRFNNKHLVNLSYVQVVFPMDASKVILENGKEIFVSKDRKESLFEHLKQVFELHETI